MADPVSMMLSMVSTTQFGEALFVPANGPLHVYQQNPDPIRLLTGPGKYVCVHVRNEHVKHPVHIHFRATDENVINLRATAVLAELTDVCMTLTGPVVFTGLPGDRIFQIIQKLSREGA